MIVYVFLIKIKANILCHTRFVLDYQTINNLTDANLLKQKQEYIQIMTTVMCIQFQNTLKVIFFYFSLFLIQQNLTTKSMCIFVCFIDELDRTCPVERKSQSEEIQGSNTDHCYAISKSEASRGIKQ